MATRKPVALKTKAPSNVFTKPLSVDLSAMLKAVGKGIGHTATGKWAELSADTVEALASLGVSNESEELAFILIRRSLIASLFSLLEDSLGSVLSELNEDAERILTEFSRSVPETYIDSDFFNRPGEIQSIKVLTSLLGDWLTSAGVSSSASTNIAARLPSYFTYALNNEWRKNAKAYQPLKDLTNSPFWKAGEREWAWSEYAALLRKRCQESVFEESFSLAQIYVPLNAYFIEDNKDRDAISENISLRKRQRRHVISLSTELNSWIHGSDPQDTIRVVSGGPGSGKSSFARIFSADLSAIGTSKVLFVPLHLIDPLKDIVSEVGRFVRDEGILLQNPLDSEDPEPSLLVIFDGLDELASQGKAAAETARAFVREIERVSNRLNLNKIRLRILLSGREVVVQENESEFRGARQVLTILPYHVNTGVRARNTYHYDDNEYIDPNKLLSIDLRQQWWSAYGQLTGQNYGGLPQALDRLDLSEITGQPLLNYLVALSFSRGKIDFTKDLNLNSVYGDLVVAVHERGYEKRRSHVQIRNMKVSEFSRVLEEVGLAAWHGDGRTTTVNEIEEHCKASGLGRLLALFQEGAKAGVTRLLAAFFFRQHGQRSGGEPTFVFTHKSFGEYLTARRIVRSVERVSREVSNRVESPDMGWDERDALRHWVQVSGPSGISPYLHSFLINEIALQPIEALTVWQSQLTHLFSYMLRHGMPMDQTKSTSFRELQFFSRNAEEALIVLLNACARVTKRNFRIDQPDRTSFGAWFRRIQGQRSGPEPALVAKCLSYIDLRNACLDISDFYGADLSHSNLQGVDAHYSCFSTANLSFAQLARCRFTGSLFERTLFLNAKMTRGHFDEGHFEGADLTGANVIGTIFQGAELSKTDTSGVDLLKAKLEGAKLPRGVRQALRMTPNRSVEQSVPSSDESDDRDMDPV